MFLYMGPLKCRVRRPVSGPIFLSGTLRKSETLFLNAKSAQLDIVFPVRLSSLGITTEIFMVKLLAA